MIFEYSLFWILLGITVVFGSMIHISKYLNFPHNLDVQTIGWLGIYLTLTIGWGIVGGCSTVRTSSYKTEINIIVRPNRILFEDKLGNIIGHTENISDYKYFKDKTEGVIEVTYRYDLYGLKNPNMYCVFGCSDLKLY